MANIDEYIDLIPSENKEKPKFIQMITDVIGAFVDGENTVESLVPKFNLDNAEGDQLDIIGQWVGVSRYINQILIVNFFGFSDNIAALPFGEEGNLKIGGRFYGEGDNYEGSSILEDPEYRLLIRAKIVKNQSNSTIADILTSLNFLFPGTDSRIYDNSNMSFAISIGRELTLTEISIIKNIDILPRPAGVRISSISYFEDDYLGFEGFPTANPFAEEGTTAYGFLAEEI